LEGKAIPEISRLTIEIDSDGVMRASGNLDEFAKKSQKAAQSTDGLAQKFGAFQLIVNKLPGPLKSVAAGLLGMVNPATAAAGAIIELGEMAIKYADEAINAYAEQEAQLVRLGAVLKATGAETWTTTAALSGYADQLQSITGKSSNQIKQMQSVLLGFTNITGQNFDRLTKNMIDMVDVMGGDMVSAANTFGKAMDNPAESISALTRYGFKFTEEQKRMIKTMQEANDVAGAQVVILEAMERAFGGTAEAHGQTIQGLKDTYKSLKEQNKELLADINGWAEFAKAWALYRAEAAKQANEELKAQKEINDILKRERKGEDTTFDKYSVALSQVKTWTKIVNDAKLVNSDSVADYERVLKEYQDIVDALNVAIDSQDEYNRKQEEFFNISKKGAEEYRNIQANIEEAYAKTAEGQKIAIENEIKLWQERLKATHLQGFDKWGTESQDKSKISYYKEVGISDEEANRIEAILKKLREGAAGVKAELTDWQKIFASAMNLTDKDTKQDWFKRQATAISEFTRMLSTANERAKVLSNTFGTDLTKNLEKAAEQWEQLASDMIMSGEWKENNGLFLQVVELARQARAEFENASLDNLISDTERELSLLRMTTSEMEKQKLMSEYRFANEEKINELLERRRGLTVEQEKLDILSTVTGAPREQIQGMRGRQLSREIAKFMGEKYGDALTHANMAEFGDLDMAEKIRHLSVYAEKTASIADHWEKIYMAVISAGKEVNGEYVQLFDPEIEENYELIKDILFRLDQAKQLSKTALFNKDETGLKEEIDSLNKLLTLGEKKFELEKLTALYGDEERAKKIYALNQEKEATEALIDALNRLKEAGLQITASGLIDFAHDLGSAFRDGTISSDELSGAVGNMLKAMIDAMPQLLLNVGLQLIMAKQWALGLAFIGASGLMSFVSGLIDDSKDSGRDEEEERLRRIRDQITDLIEQQRKQAEYYATKKRSVDASSISVNDAIITPKGTVYTHPEDYIIATKRPDTLMSNGGGGANVNVIVNNYTDASVSRQDRITADGTKEIALTIKKLVGSAIANGDLDGAFNAMNNRRAGKRMQNW